MSLPLEKASYRAVAVATTLGSSKDKGTKFIAVNFEVIEGDFAGEAPRAWMGYITANTEARIVESLQHMGYEGDNLEDFADLDRAGCQKLLPNVVEIVCEPESYNDKETGEEKWSLKVQWVNRVGGGRFKAEKPLEGGELKAFSAQMKSVFRNARGPKKPGGGGQVGSTGASREVTSNGAKPDNDFGGYGGGSKRDDDLPFASCSPDHEPMLKALR